ncbi:MAG TPA: entericidin A/B family lipoprotein [Pusillimonas sp.]|nr:entericidin A/B family lipoprotein [Pusillimonas sp.]HUH87280.1 entericidin A/B family lipoprotein [Pusillimonas sp.]
MKTRVWLPILLAVAALVGGCKNTLHGAGEDIERGGEKIQQNTR